MNSLLSVWVIFQHFQHVDWDIFLSILLTGITLMSVLLYTSTNLSNDYNNKKKWTRTDKVLKYIMDDDFILNVYLTFIFSRKEVKPFFALITY